MGSTEKQVADSFTDKAGQAVKVGDHIVYGHAMGRCAGLRFGKVLKIERVKTWRDELDWRIRVVGVDDDWSHREPELSKRGTLMYPERTINANGFIPDAYRKLLENEA